MWLGAPAADTAAPDAYAFPWFGAVANIDLETRAASYWRPQAEATLDARDLSRGPIARVDAGVALPGASHVTWAPQ